MKKGFRKQFCINGHNTFICGRYKSNGVCIKCNVVHGRIYYESNKKEHNEDIKLYRSTHKEQYKVYQKQYKINNKEKIKDYLKNYKLLNTYNITLEYYNNLLLKQDYKCAGCLKPQEEFKIAFAIDHDHGCCLGKKSCGNYIRGLLCTDCNLLLGSAKDNPEVLTRLASYLTNLNSNR